MSPQHDLYRRQFAELPVSDLTPALAKLAAEADSIAKRRTAADVQVRDRWDAKHDIAAAEDDRHSAGLAVRAGGVIGTPAADKLRGDRDTATRELNALDAALSHVEADMQTEFETAWKDDTASGRAALAEAASKLRTSIDAASTALNEYLLARRVRDMYGVAVGAPSYSGPLWPKLDTAGQAALAALAEGAES